MKRLPVIVTDIDGVLVRGRTQIPGTLATLLRIKQAKIPFVCLTNGGGSTEQVKADKMNKIFGFKDYFSKDNVILNHTPLKSELLKWSKQGTIMITGSMDIISIVQDLGIKNYITADEIYTMIVNELPEGLRDGLWRQDMQFQKTRFALSQRPGFTHPHNSKAILPHIKAVFTLNDVSPYETSLLVLDHLYRVSNAPYYTSQNDLIWASQFPLSRMAMGPFTRVLENHIMLYLKKDIHPIIYGKPTKLAFSYVEHYMKSRHGEVGNFYMIGDNPKADIRGANNIGWASLMTRTGVFKGDENDPEDPATYVVQNFQQAISKIFEVQKL